MMLMAELVLLGLLLGVVLEGVTVGVPEAVDETGMRVAVAVVVGRVYWGRAVAREATSVKRVRFLRNAMMMTMGEYSEICVEACCKLVWF